MALQPGLCDPREVGLRPGGEGGAKSTSSRETEGGESISRRRAAVAHSRERTLKLLCNITFSEHLSLLSIQHCAHTAHTCCSITLPSPPSTSSPSPSLLHHHHHFSTSTFHCTVPPPPPRYLSTSTITSLDGSPRPCGLVGGYGRGGGRGGEGGCPSRAYDRTWHSQGALQAPALPREG